MSAGQPEKPGLRDTITEASKTLSAAIIYSSVFIAGALIFHAVWSSK